MKSQTTYLHISRSVDPCIKYKTICQRNNAIHSNVQSAPMIRMSLMSSFGDRTKFCKVHQSESIINLIANKFLQEFCISKSRRRLCRTDSTIDRHRLHGSSPVEIFRRRCKKKTTTHVLIGQVEEAEEGNVDGEVVSGGLGKVPGHGVDDLCQGNLQRNDTSANCRHVKSS